MAVGTDKYGKPLRNRTMWKCKHCNELQFATANNRNKEVHLDNRHGITKHGNKTPRPNPFRQIHLPNTPAEPREPIRQSEAYVQLPVMIKSSFFQAALVAFIVLCHLAISLIESTVFIEFLTVLYPSLGQSKLLPRKDTMRTWIIDAFEVRKKRMGTMLQESKSKIHFSFDLWTSPKHLALLGIVAHFVDARAQNQSVCQFTSSSMLSPFSVAEDHVRTGADFYIFILDPYCNQTTQGSALWRESSRSHRRCHQRLRSSR